MIEYREDCKWCRENRFNEERIRAIAREVAKEEIDNLLRFQRLIDEKIKEQLRNEKTRTQNTKPG